MNNKLKTFLSLFFVLALGFVLIACTPKKFTVTFDTDGGTAIAAVEVTEDEKVSRPTDPTKDGFDFNEWQLDGERFDFDTPITADITLKATWTSATSVEVTFTVTLPADTPDGDIYMAGNFSNFGSYPDWNPGSEEGALKLTRTGLTATTKLTLSISETTLEYKITRGSWASVEQDADGVTIDNRELVVSAATNTVNITVGSWEDLNLANAKLTVQFDSNGGSIIDDLLVDNGGKVTKPTDPTRPGFTFIAWQLDGTDFNFDTEITTDITLKAVWEVTDADLLALDKENLTLATTTFNVNGTITLPETGDNGSTITWVSSDAAAIDVATGAVTLPSEAGTKVITLTATLTKGTATDTKEFVITLVVGEEETTNLGLPVVDGAITIASFLETKPEDAIIVGVVTSIAPHNSFSIEDETGAVALRISGKNSGNIDFKVGDAIEANVKHNEFNGLIQAEVLEDTYTVHEGTYERLALVNLNETGLDEADLLSLQSRAVKLENVTVVSKSVDSFGSINIVVELDDKEITIRWDNRVAGFDNAVMVALNQGDVISIEGATLSWYNGPQLMVDKTEQIVLVNEVDTVTVTFNTDGGTAIDPIIVVTGETITLPGAPSKDGFEFVGWFTDEALTTEFEETTAINADITLYAKWEETDSLFATLQYEAGGGTKNMDDGNNAESVGLNPDIFNVLSTSRQLPDNLHVGLNNAGQIRLYGHSDYASKNTLTVIATGKVITKIEITYLAGSSSPSSALLVLGDDELVLSSEDIVNITKTYDNLSIDGFSIRNTQDGGSGNSQIFIEKIVITYEEGTAEKTFVKVPVLEVTIDYGYEIEDGALFFEPNDSFDLPSDPTRDGFNFEGWFLDAEFTEAATALTAITEEFTLYAKWEEDLTERFTVTFNTDGGTAIDSVTVVAGETITLPGEPLKDGFEFIGWFIDDEEFDFDTPITSDLTLTAKWEEKEEDEEAVATIKAEGTQITTSINEGDITSYFTIVNNGSATFEVNLTHGSASTKSIFNNGAGETRLYVGLTLEINVPEAYVITNIKITTSQNGGAVINGTKVTGLNMDIAVTELSAVTIFCDNGQVRIKNIEITYSLK